jgi:hypothetical protein
VVAYRHALSNKPTQNICLRVTFPFVNMIALGGVPW